MVSGQANYAAAKSAVIGLTKTIAKEWGAFGVRANTVAFGYIQTRWDYTRLFHHYFLTLLSRLTQAKEAGASIVIDGKKVPLGIPGAKPSNADGKPPPAPGVPLGRPGTPDEAAASILLYVPLALQ